jgi:hypothetical protein
MELMVSYYDLTGQYCNDVWGAGWGDKDINNGVPTCNGQHNITLRDMGTNRIVGELSLDCGVWPHPGG